MNNKSPILCLFIPDFSDKYIIDEFIKLKDIPESEISVFIVNTGLTSKDLFLRD